MMKDCLPDYQCTDVDVVDLEDQKVMSSLIIQIGISEKRITSFYFFSLDCSLPGPPLYAVIILHIHYIV